MSLTITAQQMIENMLEGVLITDPDGVIETANPAFVRSTGYSLREIVGKTPRILRSGRHKPYFYRKMWTALKSTGHWSGEIINQRKNGEIYTEWLEISAIRNQAGSITHYMGLFSDITKEKRAQETIRHMAYFDPLTDLPNRTLFRERLNHALIDAERKDTTLGVLFLDLDRVKIINDTLGHDMGDRLLIGVASRLKACLRPNDVVARLGGDEFMILLPEIGEASRISAMCEDILGHLRPPFFLDGHEIYTTASIGISVYPFDGRDAETLLKNADTAMYRAKRLGRNTYQTFNSSMKTEVQQQLTLGNSLRRAIDRHEFLVYYQPQFDLRTNEIVGIEALVRWAHPELGIVAPGQFIQWAEDSGLIVPLGELVLRMACEQSRRWQDAGLPPIKVAVNLSAAQFRQGNIVETVSRVLRETKLPPRCLELELTESVVMELTGTAVRVPHELKAMGVGFSIDDFGTGYSSLSYLRGLPVNTLKMDKTFVKDITTNPNDAAIASAVVALGHGLGLVVTAEGVETHGQLEHLRAIKCDRAQGFLFSPPLPAQEFERLLHARSTFPTETLFG